METAVAAQGTAIVRSGNTIGSRGASRHPFAAERESEVLVDLATPRVSAGSAGHMESFRRCRWPTEQALYFSHCQLESVGSLDTSHTSMARLTREI